MANRFDLINLTNTLQTTSNGTVANVNFDSNTLFVDGVNNRVGVGTSSPTAPLQVWGNAGGVGQSLTYFSGNSTYNGIGIQGRSANSTTYSATFIDAINEGGATVANILCDINTDGSSAWSFGAQSSGTRTDRRVERMRIDSGGRVTIPGQPMFSGGHNSVVTYSTGQLIQITALYDPLSMFSGASNYRVTVPVAGRYLVTADFLLDPTTTGPLAVHIRKNGVNQRRLYSSNGYNYQSGGTAIILNCAANDYIDLTAQATQKIWGDDIGMFNVIMLG